MYWETVAGVAVIARSRETCTRTGRPMVAGVAVIARIRETCTRTGRPKVAGVAMVASSRETCTRTRRPMVAGVAVVARIRETCTRTGRPKVAGVAVVARSWETCTRTGRPMVVGERETYACTGRPIEWICIIFIAVEPLLTDTSLKWTPLYYRQFAMSRQSSHSFTLKKSLYNTDLL